MHTLRQSGMFSDPVPPFGEENDNRRRVSHVSRACDQCRQRKCKCDGKPAVCYACRISSLPCTWKGIYKRGGVSAEVEALRNRVQALEDLCATLVSFFNLNGADGGAHLSPSIKTPDTACQFPLTPVSTAPSSPGSMVSLSGDGNFLTVPSDRRHMRGGSVSSTDSGFIPWGSVLTSPSASYHSIPYSAPSDEPTTSYGPVGEFPQNVGYVIEQLANFEDIPMLVWDGMGGESAEENPARDSSMDDTLWHERPFKHT